MRNYLRITAACVLLGLVTLPTMHVLWGDVPMRGGVFALEGCWLGFMLAEFARKRAESRYGLDPGMGFIAGGLFRMGVPLLFLIFSIKNYQDPMDKSFVEGIIGVYFVSYPALLGYSVWLACRAQTGEQAAEACPEKQETSGNSEAEEQKENVWTRTN